MTELVFYCTPDSIAEIVYDYALQPEIQFAVFDMIAKKVSYCPELHLEDGSTIKPLQLDLIKEGKLLLPSSADEYGAEAHLLEEIEEFVSHFLDLPHPFYLKLVSHYTLLTWVYDKLSVVPYLRAFGDYGCGKTRFAQVVGSICYKPLFLAGATSDAFIFRMIELFKGTIILNELERLNTDLQSQLVVILNNGYEKGLYVGRIEGEKKREPRTFDVFGPKIITSRVNFKDLALESRILSVPMRPTKRKDIPVMLDEGFWQKARGLRNKLLMYRFQNLLTLDFEDKQERLSGVEPRLKQTLLPLFYVIQDKAVEEEFIKYALKFQEQIFSERSYENEALIAEKLVDLLENNERVNVKDVAESINKELDDKEKLSCKAIGKKIRGFGFQTKRVQGVYQIIPNQMALEYLKDRYGLSKDEPQDTVGKSPLSPPSPLPDSDSKGDLVDLGDIENSSDKGSADNTVAVAEEIFGGRVEKI